MRKQIFGNREVAVIGLGSSEFGGKCPESLAREFMDTYTGLGGNFIDTARVYGDFVTPRNGESEKVIGRWMSNRHCRDQLFLSTKGGHPQLTDMHRSRLSREEIRSDMAESLENLQTDYVDIYWLHRDDTSRPVGEIMESLQSLVDDGTTRMIGVSNWRPARIMEALTFSKEHGLTLLSANQPQFSLAVQASFADQTLVSMDNETYRMHLKTGLACCCFSSQARGFFTRLDKNGPENLPEGLKKQYLCPENLAIYSRMKEIQQETGLDIQSIALSFLTSQPFPTFALVGASKPEHILSLRNAGDAVLNAEQTGRLRSFTDI